MSRSTGGRVARLRRGRGARRRVQWAIDIELCVFPQEGLTDNPGTDQLLVQALKRGAKAVGAAPNYDSDHAGQIRRIFKLAREFGVEASTLWPSVGHADDSARDDDLARSVNGTIGTGAETSRRADCCDA